MSKPIGYLIPVDDRFLGSTVLYVEVLILSYSKAILGMTCKKFNNSIFFSVSTTAVLHLVGALAALSSGGASCGWCPLHVFLHAAIIPLVHCIGLCCVCYALGLIGAFVLFAFVVWPCCHSYQYNYSVDWSAGRDWLVPCECSLSSVFVCSSSFFIAFR